MVALMQTATSLPFFSCWPCQRVRWRTRRPPPLTPGHAGVDAGGRGRIGALTLTRRHDLLVALASTLRSAWGGAECAPWQAITPSRAREAVPSAVAIERVGLNWRGRLALPSAASSSRAEGPSALFS